MKLNDGKIKGEATYTSTRNACKLCSPLGACLVFKGIRGCVPLIHGSQGCATYIRRYLISHYREPVDIASSNFSEESTVFGGNRNFNVGIKNIIDTYSPEVIGIASTCLSETIGEDVPKLLYEFHEINKAKGPLPGFISASTPSYNGTHAEGFHKTVFASVKQYAQQTEQTNKVNIFPGFISPEDIRYLKEICQDFQLPYMLFPDYSETLDNTTWKSYKKIPDGGTSIEEIKQAGGAKASIEFGTILGKRLHAGRIRLNKPEPSAGEYLEQEMYIKNHVLPMPIGIRFTDRFFNILKSLIGKEIPEKYVKERGRLIDAYIDGHKQVFDKKAVVYGEEDFVLSMTSFLTEIGIKPVLVATGGESKMFKEEMEKHIEDLPVDVIVGEGWDFERIKEKATALQPDLIIGNSKGYYISRALGIPLVRVGFPVHDRIGAQRILHLGYRGGQQLFDKIVNAIIEFKQEKSDVGYKYM